MQKFSFLCIGILFILPVELHGQVNSVPSLPSSITKSKLKKHAFSNEWLKLIHYKKNLSGNYESQVDAKTFFLAPHGKKDPLRELTATLKYFLRKQAPSVISRFPARYKYINKTFNLQLKQIFSKELTAYLNKTMAKSVSVAFSSYYLNNPGSIFGHTLLKLKSNKSDLLEYGINFAADIGNDSILPYLFKGLFGGHKGIYSILPFFDKVREYNDYENRDLWIYHLDLNKDEMDTLQKHLWELIHAGYDYYFFTENCAYHVLSALEAARPECDLTKETKGIVLPVDILSILKDKNMVTKIDYRPSLRNIFFKQYSRLNKQGKKKFHSITKSDISNVKLSEINSNVLTALIDYYNFKFPSFLLENNKKDKKAAKFKKRLLMNRRKTKNLENNTAEEKKPKFIFEPHNVHDSFRLTLYSGFSNSINKFFIAPEFRLLYHDLNDSPKGYPLNTEIEFIKFSGKFLLDETQKHTYFLNEITLLKITSLNDFSFYQKGPSWYLYLGGYRTYDGRTDSPYGSFAPTLSLGLGLSKILAREYFLESIPSLIIFGLGIIQASASDSFSHDPYSFGGGVRAGFKFTLTDSLNITCIYEFIKYIQYNLENSIKVTGRFQPFQNFALDFTFFKSLHCEEYIFGLMLYF